MSSIIRKYDNNQYFNILSSLISQSCLNEQIVLKAGCGEKILTHVSNSGT